MVWFSWFGPLRSSRTFWEVSEYVGESIVIVGVFGEAGVESIENEEERKQVGRRSTRILIIGLFVALVAISKTNQISDEAISEAIDRATSATTQASAASTQASAATTQISAADVRIAELTKETEVYKSKFEDARERTVKLESAIVDWLRPRQLTKVQVNNLLKAIGGGEFVSQKLDIIDCDGSWEASQFALNLGIRVREPMSSPHHNWYVRTWRMKPNESHLLGVRICVRKGADPITVKAEKALVSAIAVPGINARNGGEFSSGPLSDFEMAMSGVPLGKFEVDPTWVDFFSRIPWDDNSAANIRIFIGDKHDTDFQFPPP
jgi:hypothetical protein